MRTLSPESPLSEAENSHFGEDIDEVSVAQTLVFVWAFPPAVGGGSI